AGDGIRDRNVTGVQTCALPISVLHAQFRSSQGYSVPISALSGETTVHPSAWIRPLYRRASRTQQHGIRPCHLYDWVILPTRTLQIGRASCRERRWIEGTPALLT